MLESNEGNHRKIIIPPEFHRLYKADFEVPNQCKGQSHVHALHFIHGTIKASPLF